MPSFPRAFCSHIPRTLESPTPSFTLSGANTRFALAKGHPKDTQAPLVTSQSSAWGISSSLMVPKEFAVSCHQVPRQPIDRKARAFRFCTHPSQEPPCPSGPGDTWQETQLPFKAQPPRESLQPPDGDTCLSKQRSHPCDGTSLFRAHWKAFARLAACVSPPGSAVT